jgi:hypothetical protein
MVKILGVKTGEQPITGLHGHVNLNKDAQAIKYDIDRALPIIITGGASLEEIEKKVIDARNKGELALRIAVRGGDTLVLGEFHYDRLEYLARVFGEIKEDMDKLVAHVKAEGFTNFM